MLVVNILLLKFILNFQSVLLKQGDKAPKTQRITESEETEEKIIKERGQ